MFFTNLFLLFYKNNNQSFKVSNYFDFYHCYGNKNGHQNRLKNSKMAIWSKIERFDREINIEHKQLNSLHSSSILHIFFCLHVLAQMVIALIRGMCV